VISLTQRKCCWDGLSTWELILSPIRACELLFLFVSVSQTSRPLPPWVPSPLLSHRPPSPETSTKIQQHYSFSDEWNRRPTLSNLCASNGQTNISWVLILGGIAYEYHPIFGLSIVLGPGPNNFYSWAHVLGSQ
jgi:hypothetical protein